MKHLIIDGYNLLFLVGFPGTDLHEQRSTLLKALSDYATLLNLNALIVFDSHYQKGECTHTTQRDISILYTNEGETADDHILSLIKSTDKPEALTVVTSDKRLACKVRALHAKTQEVKSFFEELKHRTAKKIHPPSQKPLLPNITAPKPKQKETANDYYYRQFMDAYEEQEEKIVERALKKNKIAKPAKPAIVESDMARWLRLFENPNS